MIAMLYPFELTVTCLLAGSLLAGGIIVFFRRPARHNVNVWVILNLAAGISLMWTYYLRRDSADVRVPITGLYDLKSILEWYFILLLFALTPLIFNQTKLKLRTFILGPGIFLVCLYTALCYAYFSGGHNPYPQPELLSLCGSKEAQLDMAIGICSVVTLLMLFYKPLAGEFGRKMKTIPSRILIHTATGTLLMVLYVSLMWGVPKAEWMLGLGCTLYQWTVVGCLLHRRAGCTFLPFSRKDDSGTDSLEHLPDTALHDSPRLAPDVLIRDQKLFLQKRISVERLAQQTGYSPREIFTEVKKQGYTQVNEYLNEFRLEHFKKLVKESQGVPIWTLASESGFSSRAVFYRYFQKKEGNIPSHFMKTAQKLQIHSGEVDPDKKSSSGK